MAGKQLVGSTKKKHSGRGVNDRRQMGEEILRRRNRGEKLFDISKALGIGEATATRYLDLALEARIAPLADDYRKQQNDRLDETQRRNDEQIEIAERIAQQGYEASDPDLILKAAQVRHNALTLQVRIDERRARLNGLDAPVVVEATVKKAPDVDPIVADIMNEHREAETA